MRRLRHGDANFAAELAAFGRVAEAPREIANSVAAILADVRVRGDEAVAHYAEKFDGARLNPAGFRVASAVLTGASRRLSADDRRALDSARALISDFNRRGRLEAWSAKNRQGARVGEKWNPIRRVGIYVPAGLASTALMTATLARLAGCPEIAACTPGGPEGRISDVVLAALHGAGVGEVYGIGGVQAIGAMAYGTATIPAVDKIFGPGNAYVCEAKRQVFGVVGVDALPGPSELMVIADETARPDFAAADLLAQAEHGTGREKIYLVAKSARIIDAVVAAIDAQLGRLGRSEKIARVLADGFLAIEARTPAQAAAVANAVAPEHLQLLVKGSAVAGLVRAVTTAGAIMIGNDTPTALGDFVAGPSHVLPTGGSGRFSSGLRVADFLRRTSIVRYDRASVRRAAPLVAAFAAMERLPAHGRSVQIRTE